MEIGTGMLGDQPLSLASWSYHEMLKSFDASLIERKLSAKLCRSDLILLLEKIRRNVVGSSFSEYRRTLVVRMVARIRFIIIQLRVSPAVTLQREILQSTNQIRFDSDDEVVRVIEGKLETKSTAELAKRQREDRRLEIIIRLTTEEYREYLLRRAGYKRFNFGAFTVWNN